MYFSGTSINAAYGSTWTPSKVQGFLDWGLTSAVQEVATTGVYVKEILPYGIGSQLLYIKFPDNIFSFHLLYIT